MLRFLAKLFFATLPLSIPIVALAQRVPNQPFADESRPALSCSPAPCLLPEISVNSVSTENAGNFLVNPTDPQQWLAGGGAKCSLNTLEFGSYSSSNAGESWSTTCLPPLDTTVNQNEYPPVFAYDTSGVAYSIYNSAGQTVFPPIVLAKSTDNGVTWGAPQVVDNNNDGFSDVALQGAIDANPSSPFVNGIYIITARGMESFQVEVEASHDGGATFQTSTVVAAPPSQAYPQPEIAIGSDGTVYVTATYCQGTRCRVLFSRSTDGGSTWTKPRTAATTGFSQVVTSITQPGVIAVDNSSGSFAGRLYIVTTNYTGASLQVALTRSSDGGKTWGKLVPIAPGFTQDQANPWATVSSTGTLGVSWMDRRDDPNNTDYRAYLAISSDGGHLFGSDFAIDNGLETALPNALPNFPVQNVWDGNALLTMWSSFGSPAGIVVGGAQFN